MLLSRFVDLTPTTYCQIDGEYFVNICGLLRKHELYKYSGVSNNATVWNKYTGQGIFPKMINAQG